MNGGTRRASVGLLLVLCLASVGGACSSVRLDAAEAERIAEILGLEPGLTMADVGAGEGEWSSKLCGYLAPGGHLFATEVTADLIDEIEQTLEDSGCESYTVLLGDQLRTGLERQCCDVVLLRLVYHHFQDPAPMRADLEQSVRPGGRLGIIDIVPQEHWRELEGVPDRGGHGVEPEDVAQDMTQAGFELVARHDSWNDDPERYFLLFRRLSAQAEENP